MIYRLRESLKYAMENGTVLTEHLLVNLDEVADLFPSEFSKTKIEELIRQLVKEWAGCHQ